MPGVLTIEAIAQCGAVAVLADEANTRQDPLLRRDRRLPLQAGRGAGRRARARVRVPPRARADREGPGPRERRRRRRRRGHADRLRREQGQCTDDRRRAQRHPRLDHRPRRLRARARGDERRARRSSSTPRTSGSWSAPASASGGSRRTSEALSDLSLPAARQALEQAGIDRRGHRPADRRDRDARHGVPLDRARSSPTSSAPTDAAAYDLSAGCTGFMYAVAQALRDARRRASRSARSSSAATSSRASSTGATARRSSSSATARARSCSSRSDEPGFLGVRARRRRRRRRAPLAAGQRLAHCSRIRDEFVKMNGREVFKFATRILVQSAEAVLATVRSKTIDDVDVYVPHQANVRIIDHATRKLGIPSDKCGGQCRPVRQHVLGLDPARAGGCAAPTGGFSLASSYS